MTLGVVSSVLRIRPWDRRWKLDSQNLSYLDAVVGVLAAERLVEEEAVQGWLGRPTIGRFTP